MNNQNQRVSASLYSLLIGDALSMPVHWFYRASDIVRYFPPYGIAKMEPAPADHPSSIMSLHSTQAGGRRRAYGQPREPDNLGSNVNATERYSGEVVGDIILKGKAEHWDGQNTHYHHGLKAGDNTLNAYCARLMMRHLVEQGGYDKSAWLDAYIDFMTAEPARHPDTYAESYHRGFFANLKAGLNPEDCGAITHDTPSMGALVTVAPLAFALFKTHRLEQAQSICCEHVQLTHPDAGLMKVVRAYVSLLHSFFHHNQDDTTDVQFSMGEQLQTKSNAEIIIEQFKLAASSVAGVKLDKLLQKKSGDASIVGGLYSTACYISDSWPSVCYLAAKYYKTPGKALLINTNLGGENAHRGAVLGSLIGVAVSQYDDLLFSQLLHLNEIQNEVEQFNDRFVN